MALLISFVVLTVRAFVSTPPLPTTTVLHERKEVQESSVAEQTEAFLRAQGFVFDETRKSWTRPPRPGFPRRRPALVRSGARILEVRFEDSVSASTVGAARSAAALVKEALERPSAPWATPRAELEGLGLRVVSHPAGFLSLVGVHLGLLAFLSTHVQVGGLPPVDVAPAFVGVMCAVAFVAAATIPSPDPPGLIWWGSLSGTLEKFAADGAAGAYAFPAPRSWRASDAAWRGTAAMLEVLAAAPRCLVLHCAMQAPLETFLDRHGIPLELSALAAVLVVAAFAAAADAIATGDSTTFDQIVLEAELDLVRHHLHSDDVDVDYGPPRKDSSPVLVVKDDHHRKVRHFYKEFLRAWLDKFAPLADGYHPVQAPVAAFVRTAAAAAAFRLAGNAIDAPLALHVCAAAAAFFAPVVAPEPDNSDDPDRAVYVVK